VKFEDLSFRQVAVAMLILALLNWATFQFEMLPKMTQQQRNGIYAGWVSVGGQPLNRRRRLRNQLRVCNWGNDDSSMVSATI
jgi:hypothetical protein